MGQALTDRIRKHPELGGLLALGAFLAVFYREVLLEGKTFVFVDASRFFYPLWVWGAKVLEGGWIPLWNPDAQFGVPYFADPQAAGAYPPLWILFFFLPSVDALNGLLILHHAWALAGFWVLARSRGHSWTASLGGSLAFGFSLNLACASWTPPALMAMSWIPWVFRSADRIRRGIPGAWWGLSLALSMQLACGYPVLSYLTVAALAAFLVVGKGGRGWSLGWVLPCVGAGAVALAYNLSWGLPFAEFLGSSNYGEGAGKFHDLGWRDLGTVVSPFLQGHPRLSGYQGPHYWVSTFYMGLPVLVLLLWGLLRNLHGWRGSGAWVLLLILSTGVLGTGPWLRFLVPGYAWVVHSGFWIPLWVFTTALLSLRAWEAFVREGPGKGARILWLFLTLAVAGGSRALTSPLQAWPFWTCVLLLGAAPFLHGVRTRAAALLAATVLSLGPPALSLNILLERDYYLKPPSRLQALTEPGRMFFTPPLMRRVGRLEGPDLRTAYAQAKQGLYPNWPLTYGREFAPFYNTLQLERSRAWTFEAFRVSEEHSQKALDLLNVRYLFGRTDLPGLRRVGPSATEPPPVRSGKEGTLRLFGTMFDPKSGRSWVATEGPDAVPVWKNPTPLPKWYTAGILRPAAGTLAEDLRIAGREGSDYRSRVFVRDPRKAGRYGVRNVALDTMGGPNRRGILAAGKGKAFLASSETAYPGWKASAVLTGGRRGPLELEVVNHAFRGMVLRDGEDRVLLEFEPRTFRLGLFLALLACGLWTGTGLKIIFNFKF